MRFGEIWRNLSPHTPLGKNFARRCARKVFLERVSDEKIAAAEFDRLGREYLETQGSGGIKRPIDGRNVAIPTQHTKRTASGKVGAAKRPRAVLGKPNTFIRRTSGGGQILQKGRRKSAPLKTLYQLVPLARAYRSGCASTKTRPRWCSGGWCRTLRSRLRGRCGRRGVSCHRRARLFW